MTKKLALGSKVIAEEIISKENDSIGEILLPDKVKQSKDTLKKLKVHPARMKAKVVGNSAREGGIEEGDILYIRINARMDVVIFEGKPHEVINFSDILYVTDKLS
jgi:hypothetical protein